MASLRVHLVPALVEPSELAGATCVVIDVLRATTTIAYALAAGAREVIPCLEVDQARREAARFPRGQAVLGGERGGVAIPGFQLGNSPGEYTADSVGGKTLVFTTTNGTRAMQHCREASEVLLASFVNVSAVCGALLGQATIELLCAGADGRVTREDALLAGAIVQRLTAQVSLDVNDEAAIARDAWMEAVAVNASPCGSMTHALAATLKATLGGRNLTALGLERDIEAAAQIDRLSVVPRLDLSGGSIG